VRAIGPIHKLVRSVHNVRRTIDVLIVTFCIDRQHSLLYGDRDFDPFEELLGGDDSGGGGQNELQD
jgi:hypothetical protein